MFSVVSADKCEEVEITVIHASGDSLSKFLVKQATLHPQCAPQNKLPPYLAPPDSLIFFHEALHMYKTQDYIDYIFISHTRKQTHT